MKKIAGCLFIFLFFVGFASASGDCGNCSHDHKATKVNLVNETGKDLEYKISRWCDGKEAYVLIGRGKGVLKKHIRPKGASGRKGDLSGPTPDLSVTTLIITLNKKHEVCTRFFGETDWKCENTTVTEDNLYRNKDGNRHRLYWEIVEE